MQVLKAPQSEILAAVKRVAAIAPARSTLPIMSNIKFQRAAGSLTLTTTDLDVQAIVSADLGDGLEDFATTVQAKRMQDVLQTMAPDQVVTVTQKERALEVRGGRSRFNVATMPAEDFPSMQKAGEGPSVTLPQRRLRGLLEAVGFAAAVNDVRYFLVGTLLELTPDGVTAVASDGAHIAKASIGDAAAQCSVILPRASSAHLLRLLPASDEPVTVRVADNVASFEFGSCSLTTKLIVARFPDWRRVMGSEPPQSVTLGREPMLRALQAVSVMTTQKFHGVHLKFSPGELRFEARIDGEDAECTIDLDYDGPKVDLGFDARKLMMGLESTDEDMIRLRFGADGHALSLTLPDGDASYRYVLMPMRL